jgi:DNA polymerase III epsilon subunit-like protein
MKILFYDFETTGLDPLSNEIITAGLINDKEHQFTFKPNKPTYGGESVHGISKFRAMQFSDRYDSLMKMLKLFTPDSYLCCYANPKQNKSIYLYDFAMLKAELYLLDYNLYLKFIRAFPKEKQIDMYHMAKAAYKNKEISGLKIKNKRASFSLDSLAQAFDIKFKHHNALEDARVTKEIFKRLSDITAIRYLSDI